MKGAFVVLCSAVIFASVTDMAKAIDLDSCKRGIFFCNSTYWTCLRSNPDRCGCLQTFWGCVSQLSVCTAPEAELSDSCGTDSRRLHCEGICPTATSITESGIGWIVALSLFLGAVAMFIGAVLVIAQQRGWLTGLVVQGSLIAKNAGFKINPKSPPLPLQSIVMPPDAEIADMIIVTQQQKDATSPPKKKTTTIVTVGDRESYDPTKPTPLDHAIDASIKELDVVNSASAVVDNELRELRVMIADMVKKEADNVALDFAVGSGNAKQLRRERSTSVESPSSGFPSPSPQRSHNASSRPPMTNALFSSPSFGRSESANSPFPSFAVVAMQRQPDPMSLLSGSGWATSSKYV